ncbi:FMN-dependent NADH-azoreductase [uncultured Amnibacterium sp.]|uniref:FMN-dependent NADH-azoreductase n=1 Tax=uncultured Amnibacterium sp. TaxID=1631851 RepID=UPI0035C9E64B
MPHLLHLDSSIDPARSRSRAVTTAFATAWRGRGDDFTVAYRDLHADPVPHLTDAASHWAPRLRRAGEAPPAAEAALQQRLLDELLAADVLVVGAPMYNYSLPSTLKAWVDHIHVPGSTAPFDTPDQPMAGKPAVLVTTRGAAYDPGTPTAGWDHTVPPLQLILGDSLGMRVAVIEVNLTLSDFVPALADQAERAAAELATAEATARDLALSLP